MFENGNSKTHSDTRYHKDPEVWQDKTESFGNFMPLMCLSFIVLILFSLLLK